MWRLLLGIALVAVGIAGRLPPRVVTGISVYSILQAAGICLVLWLLYRRREAISRYAKTNDRSRPVFVIVIILLLLPSIHLAGEVGKEIEAGRHYDRVELDLKRDEPVAALDLATHLAREESAPLRERIIRRMAELGNTSPAVTDRVLRTLLEDGDPDVQEAARDAYGKLLTPSDVVRALAKFETLPKDRCALLASALEAGTGESHGGDALAWRAWLARSWGGAEGDEAFTIARRAWITFPADPHLRAAAIARVRQGASAPLVREVIADGEARFREAAAAAARANKHQALAGALLAALKREADPAAARTQVEAIVALKGKNSYSSLLALLPDGVREAGRVATTAILARELGVTLPADRATLTAAVFRKATKDRLSLLRELVDLAKGSDTARTEVLRLARNKRERNSYRVVTLPALTNDELISLLEGSPDRDFAEAVARELKARTGKDGGRDPARWRTLLE